MAYVRKTWECGDTITDTALNNIENGIEEALECCGGGSGYDFVILKDNNSDPTVIQGDFDSVYTKVTNHEYVNGVFIGASDYHDADSMRIYPLCILSTVSNVSPRRMAMEFSTVRYYSSTQLFSTLWEVEWEEGTGISGADYHEATLSV